MHELSLVRDIVRKAEAIARFEGASRVVGVILRQGTLSALDPDTLSAHFSEAAAGTIAAGARIEVKPDEGAQELTLESVELEVD